MRDSVLEARIYELEQQISMLNSVNLRLMSLENKVREIEHMVLHMPSSLKVYSGSISDEFLRLLLHENPRLLDEIIFALKELQKIPNSQLFINECLTNFLAHMKLASVTPLTKD